MMYGGDYRPAAATGSARRFLPGTGIKIIRDRAARQPPRHALLDFDGGSSLIREGWVDVMPPTTVEILAAMGFRRVSGDDLASDLRFCNCFRRLGGR